MEIEQPSGHPMATTVAAAWPSINAADLKRKADAIRQGAAAMAAGNEKMRSGINQYEQSWQGESGRAALGEARGILGVGEDGNRWKLGWARIFDEASGMTTSLKTVLRDIYEEGRSAYDALPNNAGITQAREALKAIYTAKAAEAHAEYTVQATGLAARAPKPVDMSKLGTTGNGQRQTNGSTKDGRHRVQPMDHSSGPKDGGSEGDKPSVNSKPGQLDDHAKERKPDGGEKSDDDDKGKSDLLKKHVDSGHAIEQKTTGSESTTGNTGQPGVGSAAGQGLTPLTSAVQSMGSGGGGGSPASAMGGLSSLSSGFNPGQGLHGAGQAGSGAVRPAAMSSSPLSSMTQGFGSGLSSGMSASSSGGGFPAQAAQATGLTPAQQVASHFIGPTSPPAAAAAPPAAVNPAVAAPPAPPAPAGAAGPAGGTGMLGPYSTPTGGGSAGVAAAGAAGGAASAGAGGGAAPGGSTSSGAATLAPVPPPDERVSTPARPGKNPDLVLAESVVADLVRGAPMSVSEWAVSVIRTAAGPQVVVAGNVAGGSFIPQGVFLPSGARLAATDPSLPANWWLPFMGWPRPVDILLEHFDRLTQAVHGVTLAAIATTTALDRLPGHVRVPYGVVARQDVTGRAPVLDGGHQHRLATFDPSLLGRVKALRPDIAFNTAAGLTRAVIDAAQEATEKAGDAPPLYHADDREILDLVSKEAATQQDWAKYTAMAYEADVAPSTYATHSYDDQPETQREREAYWVRFRRARVMELVSCWEKMPPSLPDVVYAAIHAGFQPAQIITQAEQIQQSGGQS